MRAPLKTKATGRSQVSAPESFPAPVGGWNARDALAAMKPQDAVDLDNWFPQTSYCEIRAGNASHATGMTNNGKTLAVYNGLNGTSKMFCTTASGTYDVSSAGAVGASVASRTNGKHQWVMFGDGTNNWLIMCNGADKPLYYDGTNWVAVDGVSTPALTGVTTTTLIYPFVSKGRLYFIQKDTLAVWYLAAGAAGGALTKFDLSAVAKKGGFLMAGGTWTIDAGDGPDDRIAFVTSEGEAIIYAGTNPGSAAAWALVGVYDIGIPIGRRCLQKYGGDMIVLTQNGAFPLSAALQSATIDYKLALSFKIERAFTEAARLYGTVFGWEATVFPARNALLVNIPIAEDGTHHQYVMNTITKAWCRFIGWDSECYAIFNEELYFARGTAVYKGWSGVSDNNTDIVAYGKTAFNAFGSSGQLKRWTLFRPVLAANGSITFLTDLDIDFSSAEMTGVSVFTPPTSAEWNSGLWDTGLWADGFEIVKQWTSPARFPGFYAAGKLKISTKVLTVQWMASEYVYEYGGIL